MWLQDPGALYDLDRISIGKIKKYTIYSQASILFLVWASEIGVDDIKVFLLFSVCNEAVAS